jgi:hypothetical protein
MEEKKMMVDEKENKERAKKKKGEEGKGGKKREKFFKMQRKREPMKRKTNPHLNVWFGGLDSSQNGQNGLIHNWCIGGWWVTTALYTGP